VAGADAAVDGGPRLQGRVEIVEQLGSESLVYFRTDELDVVEIGERPLELKGAVCARLRAGTPYGPGDAIELAISPPSVRLFDAGSGRAVLSEQAAPAPVR